MENIFNKLFKTFSPKKDEQRVRFTYEAVVKIFNFKFFLSVNFQNLLVSAQKL